MNYRDASLIEGARTIWGLICELQPDAHPIEQVKLLYRTLNLLAPQEHSTLFETIATMLEQEVGL